MPKFILHDLSYSFNKDNPFADDNNKQRLNVLRQMVNNSLAIDIDDVDKNVNYCNLKEDITQLYGNDCDNNITDTPMIDDIKEIKKIIKVDKVYKPNMENHAVYEKILPVFMDLYKNNKKAFAALNE